MELNNNFCILLVAPVIDTGIETTTFGDRFFINYIARNKGSVDDDGDDTTRRM